jgi:two-component system nitrogen regulation sensor histidine kinase NtrY
VAVLALATWVLRFTAPWLVIAAAGTLLWLLGAARRKNRMDIAVLAALCIGVGLGAVVQFRLQRIAAAWPALRLEVEERSADALRSALDDLVKQGERAVDGAARVMPALRGERAIAFDRMRSVQKRSGVSALAIYAGDGAPLVWAGEHRGELPAAVRRGEQEYSFYDGPLFGYLYFTRVLDEGRTAVAAILLDATIGLHEGSVPFAAAFAAEHGILPRFTTPDRAQGGSVWDWATDQPIFSVSFATLTQAHWRGRVAERGRWAVLAALLAAMALLIASWYRRGIGPPGVPVAVVTAILLLVPWTSLLEAGGLFSPLRFVLPMPGDVSLGDLLVLLGGSSVWLLTRSAGGTQSRLPRLIGTGVAAVVVPLGLLLIHRSVAGGSLAAETTGGISLQLAASLLLALPLFLLLRCAAGQHPSRATRGYLLAGMLVSAALSVGLAMVWQPGREISVWAGALWSIPFFLFATALSHKPTTRATLRAWLAAGWLAGTAALPSVWILHMETRLEDAEAEVARLGTEADPFLDFLLRQFADRVLYLAAEGERGVNLLYQSWLSSGLADEGYEARITLWENEAPGVELQLTDVELPSQIIPEMIAQARVADAPLLERYTQLEAVHYLLMVPLPGARVVSVAVPPRRQLGRATALARFLRPAGGRGGDADVESLALIPIAAEPDQSAAVGEQQATGAPGIRWIRTQNGWRTETEVEYPSGPVHAHLLVRTPSPPMLLVRAALVQFLVLLSLLALWGTARTLCGELFGLQASRWQRIRSFRGRLTLALFTFFLLPTLAFGAVAYSAFSREVVRTAEALARRSLDRAAPDAKTNALATLGRRERADLLLYEGGALVQAASPEILDLGLFHTWLPPDIFLSFSQGEDLHAVETRRLAANEYLVAYRRIAADEVLALPVPLAASEISRQQREFADVVLLFTLLGAGLSVFLSLLVGRALSRPIDELSGAAAAVGAGNLRVRLPEERQDEFGGVYRAFNRMVHRVRRARAALVRETRRTEAIVAEAGTGVLALDAQGRIALVNPRACAILGSDMAVGELVPTDTSMLRAVSRVIVRFRATDAAEQGDEVEVDGRVVRLRLRRLPSGEVRAGIVVVVEDITAELRTARVLAWGEMARQVAHEIKNPLTPIKLAVQHVRRAHADRRPDFGQILDRNVEAVLREIDRLGEIARAFSRFGTPEQAVGVVERVDIHRVVQETLALYRGGHDGIEYQVAVDPAVPPVVARVGELKEVLVNLLENAREALDGTGQIRISAAQTENGGFVDLEICDTGEGIPPELLSRVFEPQFSTRTSGTGLGLAIVRRLVESWGAEVTAHSVLGEGTTVRLRLIVAT